MNIGIIEEQMNNLVVGWNGKIKNINEDGTVDVESTEYSLLTTDIHANTKVYVRNLQVSGFFFGVFDINPPVRLGQDVLVICTDTWTNTEEHKQDTYLNHKYENGIVIAGLKKTNGKRKVSDNFIIAVNEQPIFEIDSLTTDITMNSNVKINGNLDIEGTSNSKVDHISDGISGKSHVHGNVMNGGGTTGSPISALFSLMTAGFSKIRNFISK